MAKRSPEQHPGNLVYAAVIVVAFYLVEFPCPDFITNDVKFSIN